MLAPRKSLTKRAGSGAGAGSGSVNQVHGLRIQGTGSVPKCHGSGIPGTVSNHCGSECDPKARPRKKIAFWELPQDFPNYMRNVNQQVFCSRKSDLGDDQPKKFRIQPDLYSPLISWFTHIYWLGEGRLKLCLYLFHYSQSVSDVTKQGCGSA